MKYGLHLLLDLDNTLYPRQSGLLAHIDQRIDDFLSKRLDMEGNAVKKLRWEYYIKYGTTLRGVKENHGIDPLEYCYHAYDVKIDEFLQRDTLLRSILASFPGQCHVFSNSPRDYIISVLNVLGIRELVASIFDLSFSNYLGKPDPVTYQMVLENLDCKGSRCIMVEDYAINLLPAKELGMTTVLVGEEEGKKPEYVDLRLDNIYQLSTAWGNS